MPDLFLNGTSVEKGNRIITCNLRLTTVFLDAEDAATNWPSIVYPPRRRGASFRSVPLPT